eukprot:7441880-Pyramimonas_sp.AAC.1
MRAVPLGPSVELPMGPRSAVLGDAGRMRAVALGPSVKLPMGPRNVHWVVHNACGRCHWGFRWSSLWGHKTFSECEETGDDDDGDGDDDD